jgi:hypothetical protein
VEHPAFGLVVRLVQSGVPYHEAYAMSPAKRLAWAVQVGLNDGGKFDWGAMKWAKP